jgi:hypothetical protein
MAARLLPFLGAARPRSARGDRGSDPHLERAREIGARKMRELTRNVVAVILVLALSLSLAWLCGFDLDGIMWGHWTDTDSHPENYLQQQQH